MTPVEVAERLFTTRNPVSGSSPPSPIAWVVFAHGTVFVTTASRDDLPVTSTPAQLGRVALEALGRGTLRVGTPSADFTVTRLAAWFPDDPIWYVTFNEPDIVVIVTSEERDHPLGDAIAGTAGRAQRERDRAKGRILVARTFDGSRA